jgi:hypothetical protein
MAASTLAAQLILAIVWNAKAMTWLPSFSNQRQVAPQTDIEDVTTLSNAPTAEAEPLELGAGAEKTFMGRFVSSKSQAQRNIFLVVIGLQMVPVLGAGHLLGWALVGVVWVLTCVMFAAALLVQDIPTGFEAIRGSPGFGLVILSSNLADALRANLAAEELENSLRDDSSIHMLVKPSSCCSDGA